MQRIVAVGHVGRSAEGTDVRRSKTNEKENKRERDRDREGGRDRDKLPNCRESQQKSRILKIKLKERDMKKFKKSVQRPSRVFDEPKKKYWIGLRKGIE